MLLRLSVVAGKVREYNAYGLGWMYRPHEFIHAPRISSGRGVRLTGLGRRRRNLDGPLNVKDVEIAIVDVIRWHTAENDYCYIAIGLRTDVDLVFAGG